ncbi:MAG TPA: SMC-Scp complex subunit ScpB [Sedimentisphaerales bacterium]|nr:SMC-Scp complex subunit ScpB [Sedimentisphaerales bacterium]
MTEEHEETLEIDDQTTNEETDPTGEDESGEPSNERGDDPNPEQQAEEAMEIDDDEAAQPDEQVEPDAEPGSEQDAEPEIETTAESVVEAVLFASDEALTAARLADIVETSPKQIRQYIENLNEKYRANNNAFRIEQIAGGYQMLTLSPYNHWLQKLLRVRDDSKLSPASLETLAIIAYKQPIIRADIEAIRGVAVGDIVRNLMYKGLVKIVGRAEVLGRPMLYGTTKKFLETFGLNSLKDLPKIEELKKPPG